MSSTRRTSTMVLARSQLRCTDILKALALGYDSLDSPNRPTKADLTNNGTAGEDRSIAKISCHNARVAKKNQPVSNTHASNAMRCSSV